jgi:hypothetical protein
VSDIFLSYAREDLPRVEPVVDALAKRGWSVWWDRTIIPGQVFARVIQAALDEARCVVVLWSRDSVESDWVTTEADDGQRRGILIPALLDDVVIPLAFRRIQAANLIGWHGALPHAGFEELARGVQGILATPAARPARTSATATASAPARRRVIAISLAVCAVAGAAVVAYMNRGVDGGPSTQTAATVPKTAATPPAAGRVTGKSVEPRPPRPQESAPRGSPQAAKGTLTAGQTRENPKDGLTYVWIPPGKFTMGCSQVTTSAPLARTHRTR